MGFATDNGKTMTIQVNGAAGGKILVPADGGVSSNSITLAVGQNYEYATLQFDGSNFRVSQQRRRRSTIWAVCLARVRRPHRRSARPTR